MMKNNPPMNETTPNHLSACLEAILMVADSPITVDELAVAVEVPTSQVAHTLHDLAEQYQRDNRGFELREVGQGWRYYSHPDHAGVVERYVQQGQTARLTNAALETLAIIAYRQPVSRGQIASIRGVNVDGVVRTLLTRGLVEETGKDEETGAMLYQTTALFLEKLGIRDTSQLPPLAPFLPDVEAFDTFTEGEQ